MSWTTPQHAANTIATTSTRPGPLPRGWRRTLGHVLGQSGPPPSRIGSGGRRVGEPQEGLGRASEGALVEVHQVVVRRLGDRALRTPAAAARTSRRTSPPRSCPGRTTCPPRPGHRPRASSWRGPPAAAAARRRRGRRSPAAAASCSARPCRSCGRRCPPSAGRRPRAARPCTRRCPGRRPAPSSAARARRPAGRRPDRPWRTPRSAARGGPAPAPCPARSCGRRSPCPGSPSCPRRGCRSWRRGRTARSGSPCRKPEPPNVCRVSVPSSTHARSDPQPLTSGSRKSLRRSAMSSVAPFAAATLTASCWAAV